jgi:hypothetical protein
MNPITETELAAKAVAPRVTLELLMANIASEHYFTAYDAAISGADDRMAVPQSLGLLTFCVLVLANGFTVTGESACASPENFNADIGKRLAREDAVRKIWPLMGYELRTQLAFPCPVLTDADAEADLAGTPRPDNPSAVVHEDKRAPEKGDYV